MKILVCGGRDYEDIDKVYDVLDDLDEKYDGITVISGMARGADEFASRWSHQTYRGYDPCLRYPANWDKYGRAAGPIRNQQMLDEGKPDLVVAFPGGRGTAHMIRIAKEAGVEVIEV